jgi:hypothetical protein
VAATTLNHLLLLQLYDLLLDCVFDKQAQHTCLSFLTEAVHPSNRLYLDPAYMQMIR